MERGAGYCPLLEGKDVKQLIKNNTGIKKRPMGYRSGKADGDS